MLTPQQRRALEDFKQRVRKERQEGTTDERRKANYQPMPEVR